MTAAGDTGAKRRRSPLFVEKQTYRRRRLRDAARALPALGAMLWMVPLLWPLSAETVRASRALIYLFGVWLGLVVIAALIVLALERGDHAVSLPGRHGKDPKS